MAESNHKADLEDRLVKWAQVSYPWHRLIFIGFNGLLTAINLYTGTPWWALWPLVITGGLFTLHYLVYKTTLIDDDWVNERANNVYDRSYDQGHIDSIADHNDMETTRKRTQQAIREGRSQRPAKPSSEEGDK